MGLIKRKTINYLDVRAPTSLKSGGSGCEVGLLTGYSVFDWIETGDKEEERATKG